VLLLSHAHFIALHPLTDSSRNINNSDDFATTMRLSLLPPLLVLPALASAAGNKRGLVQVETDYLQDEKIFITAPTTIGWYYSYHSAPSSSLAGLEFVPMLWGEPATADYDFATEVRGLLRDGAHRIACVLGFNEPDMGRDVGGSNMTPARAAELWKRMIEPLKGDGLKLGAPAVAGSALGKAWLKEFVDKCDNCTGSSCSPRPSEWLRRLTSIRGKSTSFRSTGTATSRASPATLAKSARCSRTRTCG